MPTNFQDTPTRRNGSSIRIWSETVNIGEDVSVRFSAAMYSDIHTAAQAGVPARNTVSPGVFYLVDTDQWDISRNYPVGVGSPVWADIAPPSSAILAGPISKNLGDWLWSRDVGYVIRNIQTPKHLSLIYYSRGDNVAGLPHYWATAVHGVIDVMGIDCVEIVYPKASTTINANEGESFGVSVTVTGDPDIWYRWFKKSGMLWGQPDPSRGYTPPLPYQGYRVSPRMEYSDFGAAMRNSRCHRNDRSLTFRNVKASDAGTYVCVAYNGAIGDDFPPTSFRCAYTSPEIVVNIASSNAWKYTMPAITRQFSTDGWALYGPNNCYIEWVTARIYDCDGSSLLNSASYSWSVRNARFAGRKYAYVKTFNVLLQGRDWPVTADCKGIPSKIKWKVGCVHRSAGPVAGTWIYDDPFTVEFEEYPDEVELISNIGTYGQFNLPPLPNFNFHPCNFTAWNHVAADLGLGHATASDCNTTNLLWNVWPDALQDVGLLNKRGPVNGPQNPIAGNTKTRPASIGNITPQVGGVGGYPALPQIPYSALPKWTANAARLGIKRQAEYAFTPDIERPDINIVSVADKCSGDGLAEVGVWFFFPPLFVKSGAAPFNEFKPSFAAEFPLYKKSFGLVLLTVNSKRVSNKDAWDAGIGVSPSDASWHGQTLYELKWSEILKIKSAGDLFGPTYHTLLDWQTHRTVAALDTANAEFSFAINSATIYNTMQAPMGNKFLGKMYARGMTNQQGEINTSEVSSFDDENDACHYGGQGGITANQGLLQNTWVGYENAVSKPVKSPGKSHTYTVNINRNIEGSTWNSTIKAPLGRIPCAVVGANWTNIHANSFKGDGWMKERDISADDCCDNFTTPREVLTPPPVDDPNEDRRHPKAAFDPYDVTDGEVILGLNSDFKGFKRRNMPDWMWVEEWVENLTSDYLMYFDLYALLPYVNTPCASGMDPLGLAGGSFCDGEGTGVAADHKRTVNIWTNNTGSPAVLVPVSYFWHNRIDDGPTKQTDDFDQKTYADISSALTRPLCGRHSEGVLYHAKTINFKWDNADKGIPQAGGDMTKFNCPAPVTNDMTNNGQLQMQYSGWGSIPDGDTISIELTQECENASWAMGKFVILSTVDVPPKGAQFPLFNTRVRFQSTRTRTASN